MGGVLSISGITEHGEVIEFQGGTPSLAGQWSRVHLDLPPDMDFDSWAAVGDTLKSIEHSVMWWIGDWLRFGERRYGEMYAQAVEVTGKSYDTLAQAKWVSGCYQSCERSQNLPWSHHLVAAPLPPADRTEALRLAEANGWSVRELKQEVSRRKTVAALPMGVAETCTVSDLNVLVAKGQKFGTIYADPPWQYDNQGTRASTENHYSGLTIDQLIELPVGELALPDAHLQLWTTNAFLFDCQRLFEAWGFEYRSSFVWVKPQMGIGNYWRNSHEFLLTAIRGNAKRFNDHSLKSWGQFDRGAHSAKPEQIRQMIEKASPGPYLEMFGRRTAPGWVVWGNQIERTMFDASVREIAA